MEILKTNYQNINKHLQINTKVFMYNKLRQLTVIHMSTFSHDHIFTFSHLLRLPLHIFCGIHNLSGFIVLQPFAFFFACNITAFDFYLSISKIFF